MTNEDLTLTPRQAEAIEATLFGQRASDRKQKSYSGDSFTWRPSRSMGGAAQRMVEDMIERGFLCRTTREVLEDFMGRDEARSTEVPADLRDLSRTATLKGLRALEAFMAKKKFDPTCPVRAKLREAIPAREKKEAEFEAWLAVLKASKTGAFEREQAARRKARLVETREAAPA
jgi:hypothetical protein